MAVVYAALGDQRQALAYYEQALPLRRQVGDRGGEATTLNNIGGCMPPWVTSARRWRTTSRRCRLRRQVGDRAGEATTLNNIGVVYAAWASQRQALAYYEQALPIAAGGRRPRRRSDDAQQYWWGVRVHRRAKPRRWRTTSRRCRSGGSRRPRRGSYHAQQYWRGVRGPGREAPGAGLLRAGAAPAAGGRRPRGRKHYAAITWGWFMRIWAIWPRPRRN